MTRIVRLALLLLLAGCAALPLAPTEPAQRSYALATPQDTTLGREAEAAAAGQESPSGFRILTAGLDGLLARAHLIAAAERTLDLQYYSFRQDDTGQLLTGLLLQAADRGVRVRLLVDDGDTVDGDERLQLLAAHPTIEVRLFNPFRYRGHLAALQFTELLMSGGRLDFRMHNKLLVADNAAALAGGRNIGDPYFQTDPASQFGDEDVFAIGPVVRELSGSFDEYWNSPLAQPAPVATHGAAAQAALALLRARLADHRERLARSGAPYLQDLAAATATRGLASWTQGVAWAHASVVSDSPDKRRAGRGEGGGRLMQPRVAEAIAATSSELLVITPFLVPGTEGMGLLRRLRQQDVRVRILTNSLRSAPELLAHAGYVRARRSLLAAGVELFEIRSAPGNARGTGEPVSMVRHGNYALHAKVFVFDRKRVFVGSMNFDQRSRSLNTEIGLIIDSPALAEMTAARFEAIVSLDNSYSVALVTPVTPGSPALVWRTREAGRLVEYHDEPARSVWQRLKLDWSTLLPIDGEL